MYLDAYVAWPVLSVLHISLYLHFLSRLPHRGFSFCLQEKCFVFSLARVFDHSRNMLFLVNTLTYPKKDVDTEIDTAIGPNSTP